MVATKSKSIGLLLKQTTGPVVIDPQNENISLSLREHGAYSPTLTVQLKTGNDKDIYVKWTRLDNGMMATRIKNTYKLQTAYVTCVSPDNTYDGGIW